MPRPRVLSLGALLCAATLSSLPGGVHAQSVEGRVVDADSGRPVASAFVRLVDASGERRAVTASDSAGRYRLPVAEPGLYRLHAEQLGYEAYESEPFETGSTTDVLTLDLRLRPSPLPIRGVEVSTDQVNRRLTRFLGTNPALLRVRPVRRSTINDHVVRGNNLSEMIAYLPIPNLQVVRTREGPCYQFRSRGCLPVYLDGARLNRSSPSSLPLEMLSTVVVLLPNELIAYPEGAVHLLTIGFMR